MRGRRSLEHEHAPWLRAIAFAYFAWSFIPLLLAIRTGFTDQPLTNGPPAGWSLRYYRWVFASPDTLPMLQRSFFLAVGTVVLAVPMGTAAAIVIGRRSGRSTISLITLIILAVAIPQTLFAANLYLFLSAAGLHVGWPAQLVGHVTIALPFVVLIVMVGVRGVHPELEASAMDLGASPLEAIKRVLLPLLAPSLVAASSVAFVLSYDNFVVSQWLCVETFRCETVPTSLFGRGGVPNPGAGSYALATLALAVSLVVVALIAAAWIRARNATRPVARP